MTKRPDEPWPLWDVWLTATGENKYKPDRYGIFMRNNTRLSSVDSETDEPNITLSMDERLSYLNKDPAKLLPVTTKISQALRQAERRLGIEAWHTFQGHLALYPPSHPTKKKAIKVWSLCPVYVSTGFQGGPCGKRIAEVGQAVCPLHQSAHTRRVANDVRRDEETKAMTEGWSRDKAQTEEIQELWAMACEARDVMHPGHKPSVSGGVARVDWEVLGMFLREIIERS